MVGKAKLGERDQLDQIIKLVLHSSEGGSQQLSSARGRAVPVGLGQQQKHKTNNNNNDNLQQGGSGLFLSVLKQALLLVGG